MLRYPGFVGNTDEAVAVSVDVVEEHRALPAALDWLIANVEQRQIVGRSARAWWQAQHTLAHMADAYDRVIAQAVARQPGAANLLPHLTNDGSDGLRRLANELGVGPRLAQLLI
jgi:hypothetical protein